MSPRTRKSGSNWRTWVVMVAVAMLCALGALTWWHGNERFVPSSGPGTYLDSPVELDTEKLVGMGQGVPVLCYHYFRSGFEPFYLLKVVAAVVLSLPTLGPKEFWTTPIGEFERQLRFFRDNDIAVLTLDDLATAADEGREVARPAVVLTIDDADRSVYELAYPLLQQYGFRAHLFLPTAKVGQKWSGLDVCTWPQLREMQASGTILLDSHGHDLHWKISTPRGWEPVFWHPDQLVRAANSGGSVAVMPARLDPNLIGNADPFQLTAVLTGQYGTVASDLMTSRQVLLASAGRNSTYLAWPYGYASDALDSLAASVGFTGTVSLHPTPWNLSESLWHIGRIGVTAKVTTDQLAGLFVTNSDNRLAGWTP